MQKVKLGQTDMEFTRLGLGTWAIGGGGWEYGWGPQDEKDSIATIIRAVELGINWIDTAAIYGLGRAEEAAGKALKLLKSRVFIATKCGRGARADGTIYPILSRETVRQECEASLRRLGVDVIDLYQIHWPEPDEKIEEAWEAMTGLVEEGKVRYIGVSNFSLRQLERVQRIHPAASLQPPYNMFRREAEEELLPYCRAHGIGVLAYSPMARGLLTGKWTRQRTAELAADDHRRRAADFIEPRLSINLEFVESLRAVAGRHGRTVAELAIAWALRNDAVTSVIVGARRPQQIEETAGAGDWQPDSDDISQIESLLKRRDKRLAQI
jgi:aryl-alcohol dehydrogenase-like predicted oxidoreductase